MKIDDLPMLLKPGEVSRITGLTVRVLAGLEADGTLSAVRGEGMAYRMYTRESVKKFLNVEGREQIPD